MIAHDRPGLAASDDNSMVPVPGHCRSWRGLPEGEPYNRLACRGMLDVMCQAAIAPWPGTLTTTSPMVTSGSPS